jgi:K+-dependent Na+/Ca+ exchanger-like protein
MTAVNILGYGLILLLCFVLLARIVDLFFIASLDKISKDLHLSSDAAGATLMAVGSSAPELFVALFAVLKPGEHQAIGIGSIVGSAIFNLLIIVGVAAFVSKKHTKLTWQPIIRDLFFYTVTVALLVWFIWDKTFTITEAIAFLGVYVLYVLAVVFWRKILPYSDMPYSEDTESTQENQNSFVRWVINNVIKRIDKLLQFLFPSPKRYYLVFSISIVLIAAISYILVEVAVVSAHILDIPEAIIALTVLAVGTSIPDLFSSAIVAKQGRGDMAVSNAIGSNIFDILVGLGLPFLIVMLGSGGVISAGGDLFVSSIILFASVIILFLLLLISKWKMGKIMGVLLITMYFIYLVWEIIIK